MTKYDGLKKLLSEMLMQKRVRHLGVKLAGIAIPDSIADHVAVSAQIAYILGYLEGVDPEKCAIINLFHDLHTTRIGDHHKISSRYLKTNEAEVAAEDEQYANLPEKLAKNIKTLINQKRKRDTKEGIVAQDADWLEQAIQAKAYVELGYKGCQNWIDNVEAALETESAKRLLELIKSDPDFINCWWIGLKKMTYTKLDS